jgi:hypothetical protein
LTFSPEHFQEAPGMVPRRRLLVLLVAVFLALGAGYPTTNFVVYAPNSQIAQQFGRAAEQYRKEKALLWLGYEMPPWPQRCPLYVKVTMGGPGGATSFNFGPNGVAGQRMEIEGPLDRLLASVLPHEVTHTVFAYYFRRPVPRWADEGGSVLSEDDPERIRHDKLVRYILNHNKAIRMRTLFSLTDYPRDVMCLYAEGFSIANFLVTAKDRQTYLKFVAHGMSRLGWDSAVRTYYRYRSVEELEEAWLAELRRTKGKGVMLVSNNPTVKPASALTTGRTLVRLTAPPVQPLEDSGRQPVYRGRAANSERDSGRFGDSGRPAYLPEKAPPPKGLPERPRAVAPDGWRAPRGAEADDPVQANLGPPRYQRQAPSAPLGKPVPQTISPVGYPD